MEGYINKDRWVDFSGLPRKGNYIDWTMSGGYKIPFQYKNVKGYINIVGRSDVNNAVIITIDKYVPYPRKVYIGNLRSCELRKFVYNKIADMRPDFIQYLDNPDDAYLYSIGSNIKLPMHCPTCDYRIDRSPQDLSQNGFCCPICGRGFSYPAKLMTNILLDLKIPFIREASKKHIEFQWAQNYRYDFYIHIHNQKIIIEMDGGFHQYQQSIDAIKDLLAHNNGFKIIRIDANYRGISNRLKYIKNNILNSELSKILPLKDVDWEDCDKRAIFNSPIRIACSLWEDCHKNVKEISEICFVDRDTVRAYLKTGKSLGLCPSYSHRESECRSHCKHVAVYNKDGNVIHVFRSAVETSALSESKLGVFISIPMISCACRGRSKTAKGFKMSYIPYDEYIYYNNILKEQCKMIINNEIVKKRGVII